jgi:hypothetical protein
VPIPQSALIDPPPAIVQQLMSSGGDRANNQAHRMVATGSILREIIMVIATVSAAIAAIFSAFAAFRLEKATYTTASRQENATYTTALYVKEVDAISTFFATAREMDNLFVDVMGVYSRTFGKPYPSKDALKPFPDKAETLLRNIANHESTLGTQASMISIFGPVDLSDHFYTIIRYYHENLAQFIHTLDYINEQLTVAVTNPKQQIVIDVAALRTTQEHYFLLLDDEKSEILKCVKPELALGRPITAQSDLAGCLRKK